MKARAGGSALWVLAPPLHVAILEALAEGRRSSERLREAVGSPDPPEMRVRLQTLQRSGLLERTERGDALGTVDYDLAVAGKQLLKVCEFLRAWLAAHPGGPLELGTSTGTAAVRVLVEGWAANLVRVVAGQPCTEEDLVKLSSGLTPEGLSRRLAELHALGFLEAREGGSGAPRFAPTRWLRHAVAPLCAGAAWERRHRPAATAPIQRHDIESAFLLAVPLLRLRPECSGVCRLAVELPKRTSVEPVPYGVLVEVEEGRIARCVSRLSGGASSWALGSPREWLTAVIEGDTAGLKINGDQTLANELAWGLHRELFGPALG